jgi:hypothetical protein
MKVEIKGWDNKRIGEIEWDGEKITISGSPIGMHRVATEPIFLYQGLGKPDKEVGPETPEEFLRGMREYYSSPYFHASQATEAKE